MTFVCSNKLLYKGNKTVDFFMYKRQGVYFNQLHLVHKFLTIFYVMYYNWLDTCILLFDTIYLSVDAFKTVPATFLIKDLLF